MSLIKITKDGSNTLYSEKFNDHYHSINGAINESMHVFIQAGLNYLKSKTINIFEVGFGTGLNAVLTFTEALKRNLTVNYTTIELYPVNTKVIEQLNYSKLITNDFSEIYKLLHNLPWGKEIKLTNNLSFTKINADFNNYNFIQKFDLIYFDAFAPEKQPEMWSINNFLKIYDSLNPGGVLTTYSSKGIVKNNLREAGFKVNRLAGPEGKRHILRAEKI